MKRIIISEWDIRDEGNYQLNIQKTNVNDCLGCWSCWIKTPGRCAHRDLDDFYHAFFQADRAVFYIQPSCDFISGKLKTLLDRMIVCALPYITYASGESHHEPRYKKMPAFEIYYKDEFSDQQSRDLFKSYFDKVCDQFHTNLILIEALQEPIL